MNNFDESKVRRATDGKFANKPHAEGDVALSGGAPDTITDDEIKGFLETYGLNHGNVDWEVGQFLTVEGPNNSTRQISIDGAQTMDDVRSMVADELDYFDADEEFDELWSREFGHHNGFTPSVFLDTLISDEKYFELTARNIRRAEQGLEPISPSKDKVTDVLNDFDRLTEGERQDFAKRFASRQARQAYVDTASSMEERTPYPKGLDTPQVTFDYRGGEYPDMFLRYGPDYEDYVRVWSSVDGTESDVHGSVAQDHDTAYQLELYSYEAYGRVTGVLSEMDSNRLYQIQDTLGDIAL